ncbi:MAG: hypothetical protein ACKO04_06065 [Actinomycetes bacterium]
MPSSTPGSSDPSSSPSSAAAAASKKVPATATSTRRTSSATKKKPGARTKPSGSTSTRKKPASKKSAKTSSTSKKPASKKSPKTPSTSKKPAGKRSAGPKASVMKPAVGNPSSTPSSGAPPADPPSRQLDGPPTLSSVPGPPRRLAACASVTEEMLNLLALFGIGEGVPLDPVETNVTLPGMGEVRLGLALTVTGAAFDLRADDGGRARVVVRAMGDVSVRSSDMEGDTTTAAAAGGLPVPQVPIPVRVEALVDPFMELRTDRTVAVGLDLETGEMVSLAVDPDVPAPEGMADGAWAGLVQMAGMMFSMMGDGLFDTLGQHVGKISAELPADVGTMMAGLGVAEGPAAVRVSSGLMSFSLPATDEVVGTAEPVPVAGTRVGLGLASSGVDHLARELLARAVGDLPLPFALEVDLGEQQVGAALRQTRLISERFPDLRSAVRTEVRPRLVGGRLELSVRAAWLELPPFLPGLVNQLSRRLGGLASLAPLNLRFPATVQAPLVPGSDDTVPIVVDDLRVTADGVGIVLGLG